MSHHCSSLIIHCIDFRFVKALQQFMADHGLTGDCDVVALAGSAKNLISPSRQSDMETFLQQIELSRKLHGISTLYLVNHMDCGAYGGYGAFPSLEAEEEAHRTDLSKAAERISASYPGISIKLFLAHMYPDAKIEIKEIVHSTIDTLCP